MDREKLLKIIIISLFVFSIVVILIHQNQEKFKNDFCMEHYNGLHDVYRGDYFCVFRNRSGSLERVVFDKDYFEIWVKLNKNG